MMSPPRNRVWCVLGLSACVRMLIANALVGVVNGRAKAQEPHVAWTQLFPAVAPGAREAHATTYDSFRKELLLFGGAQAGSELNDTWVFDGTKWTKKTPGQSPGPRSGASLAYDSVRGKAVLFGGYRSGVGGGSTAETWEWDGDNWTQRFPSASPPKRSGAAMAFDRSRGVAVLFGGGDQLPGADTWEWDGVNWTQVAVNAPAPSARSGTRMCFDPEHSVCTLFGGGSSGRLPMDSAVWSWDGKRWTSSWVLPAYGRFGLAMAYDTNRKRFVYCCGYYRFIVGIYFYLDDFGEWDDTALYYASSQRCPYRAIAPSLDWFPPTNSCILFGGYDGTGAPKYYGETWAYTATRPGSFAPYGQPCSGITSPPRLTADGNEVPWLGYEFPARLVNLNPTASGSVVAGFLGDSKTTWGSQSLPLDLSFMGMAGCQLYTNPLVAQPLQNVRGSAAWRIPVPNIPPIAGLPIYLQGVENRPGANILGVVVSDAARLVIGEK